MPSNSISAEEKHTLETAADKRLSLLYNAVDCLDNTNYEKWDKQIKRQANLFRWPKHITDLNAAKVTEQQLSTWAKASTKEGYRNHLCVRNAYAVITSTCDNHAVTHLLDTTVKVDHAQEAFRVVNDYFYPKSQPGLQRAYNNFFASTMETTNTTIVEWGAKVSKMANVIIAAGGTVDDNMKLSKLYSGLLDDFVLIKKMEEKEKHAHLQPGGGRAHCCRQCR